MARIDDAWKNIQDQMQTYGKLDSLAGSERVHAAGKLIHGVSQLKNDVEYFLTNAPSGDPRRDAVTWLKGIMDRSGW